MNPKRQSSRSPSSFRELERVIMLKVVDRKWMDHIDDMEQLRQGIGLQAYGQKDPLVEYKMNAYEMFNAMTSFHPGGYPPSPLPCKSRAEGRA